MRNKKNILLQGLIACFLFTFSNVAAEKNIFRVLEAPDSVSNGVVTIHQDARIEQAINKKTASVEYVWRVQVFSSSEQRTAKNEAYQIEEQMRETFSGHEVYTNYDSPSWKVHIGDFKTMKESQEFRDHIIKVQPSLKGDAYSVRVQIVQ